MDKGTRETITRDRTAYRHSQTYRVRFGDLDTYRHVNNKAFLGYVEDARVRYLVEVGGFSTHYDGGDGIMVVHVSIDYMSQVNAFEQVRVLTRCARLGNRSFTLHHLVLAGPEPTTSRESAVQEPASQEPADRAPPGRAPGGEPERVAAVATTIFASVSMETGRSQPNRPAMIAGIRAWEPLPPE